MAALLGFAAEAVSALQKHVFDDLGWNRAVSYIDPANHRSIALAERLGCRADPTLPTPDDDPTRVFVHPKP